MDFVFECFFENYINNMSRSGLKDRRNRQMVLDALAVVIDSVSRSQSMNTDEVAKLAVVEAINYHRLKKTENSKVSYTILYKS